MTREQEVRESIERIESEIDSRSLQMVLQAIETICDEKAQHIRENWQDEGLAQLWEQAAMVMSKASNNQAVQVL